MGPVAEDTDSILSLEQRRVAWALFATLDFLREQPEFARPQTIQPLETLLYALMDLENGRVSPLFAPKKRTGGAPPMSTEQQELLALAATGMDVLMRFRSAPLDVAARKVAVLMQGAGFRLPRRKNASDLLSKTISGFRHRLNTGDGGAPECALMTWRNYLRLVDGVADMDVEGWLENIRKHVAASSVLNNPPD